MHFTAHDAPVAIDLQRTMEQLLGAIAKLKRLVSEAPLVAARVFELPLPVADNDEVPASVIPVRVVEGQDALVLALQAFDCFHAIAGQDTRSVYRLPGVICLNPAEPQAILDQLGAINQLKTDFLCLVRQLPDRKTRFEVIHRLLPMALTLQITRQIQGYAEPVKSATFTWGRKSALRCVTRDEVIELLDDMRDHQPANMTPDTWERLLDQDIDKVNSLPADVALRYRRELKVRPLCNLLLADGRKWLREANLPILLLGKGDALRLGQLVDYDPDSDAPRRGRKGDQRQTEQERILVHLPIYRVRVG